MLGFEYGYSTAEPKALVLWEAQFGDFANGAQVVMDQFIASGEMKWLRMSGLTLLLPHGYEGQGPEHSSARLERYLQLCAQDNMQVCVPHHAGQLFPHPAPPDASQLPQAADRDDAQVAAAPQEVRLASCRTWRPGTSFHRVLRDQAEVVPGATTVKLVPDDEIKRVVLCTGKVYFDLMEEREKRGENRIQILRIEQLYPFPENVLAQELNRFPKAEMVWCQEEPQEPGRLEFRRAAHRRHRRQAGRQGQPALCRPPGICLHRRRPDEAASGRTGRLPQRRPDLCNSALQIEEFPMTIEIKVPAMGESVTEATVARWFKKEGDAVKRDEPLLELETDKVTVEVPSPAAGAIESISVQAGATVQVGALLGAIAEGKAGTARRRQAAGAQSRSAEARSRACRRARRCPKADAPAMPSAQRIAEETGIAAASVAGTGKRWPRHQGRHAGRAGSPRLRARARRPPLLPARATMRRARKTCR